MEKRCKAYLQLNIAFEVTFSSENDLLGEAEVCDLLTAQLKTEGGLDEVKEAIRRAISKPHFNQTWLVGPEEEFKNEDGQVEGSGMPLDKSYTTNVHYHDVEFGTVDVRIEIVAADPL